MQEVRNGAKVDLGFFSVLIQLGGHVRCSKLLGCAVTMQEVRNRAKFELGFFLVLIQPFGHVQSSQLLGCVVTMQEVRNHAKFELRLLFGSHSAWWSCAFQQIAWVCGHNAGGSELFPFASQYF